MNKIAIKKTILNIDWFIKNIINYFFRNTIINNLQNINYKKVPIYIISFNQYSYLINTIKWLENYNYFNIIIIDNNSNQPELLKYYKKCKYKIIRMKKNYGYKVFYFHPRFILKRNFQYFILTDPDLMPIDECKDNFVEIFANIIIKYRKYNKVGFSIKIDDIPEEYKMKKNVIKNEKRYYNDVICNDLIKDLNLYLAPIDTTFALNLPMIISPIKDRLKAIRVGYPYQVRHLPWYKTVISEETNYYIRTAKKGINHWH